MRKSLFTLALAGSFLFSAYCTSSVAQDKPVKKEVAAAQEKTIKKADKAGSKKVTAKKAADHANCEHKDKGCSEKEAAKCEKAK